MQSFSRGWSFLVQAWQMAFKDRDLLKPSIYALLVGFVVSAEKVQVAGQAIHVAAPAPLAAVLG